MSGAELIIIVVAAVFGAMVQGSVGIGLSLIAGPALVAIDPGFAPGPLIVCAQIVGVRHAIAERSAVDKTAIKRCLAGAPVGLAVGLVLLSGTDDKLMGVMIGGATAVSALALLVGLTINRTPSAEVIGGGAIALSTTIAGLPGPPAAILFNDMKPAAIRSTIGVFMIFVAVASLAGLILTGEFGGHEVRLSLLLAPGVVLGLLVSRRVRPHLDNAWFRPTVLMVALAGGLALIARQLL